jgi:hypothetical protein
MKKISLGLAICTLVCLTMARAQDDPPSSAARLSYSQGSVSFQPAGTDDWVSAVVNRPMTTGDNLWSDNEGRVELQLDGSLIRLSNNTGISLLNLSDSITQIQLSAGTLLIHVRRLDDNQSYEVDTPNLAFSILRTGIYRLNVDQSGNSTTIKVRTGEGEVTGGGTAYTVHANEIDNFTGTDQLSENQEQYSGDQDAFESWSGNRDAHWSQSTSARYVSADVVGYQDLDDNGSWRSTPEYGNIWFPRTSTPNWAPYHYGHWAYVEPWGYTWVDDEPWGFAPFHYGRWVSVGGSWGWIPAPPPTQGVQYVRPVYAPALVAWIGTPGGDAGGVAWFPLGPREVYVPSYPVSRNYVNNVNVSNTTVNTTVVNNYYNTTIVNKNVTVTNVKYVNQTVPGSVAATSSQAFTTSQPVAKNAVRVDERAMATAPVRAFTPTVVPAKQAVLGSGRAVAVKPPAAVQSRTVVAKVAPPAPPPTFEKRQEAIKNNSGKPLTVAQVRQIQPAITPQAAVKVAPPATQHPAPQNSRPAIAPNAPTTAQKPAQTQAAEAPRPNSPTANRPNTETSQPTNHATTEQRNSVPTPPAQNPKPGDSNLAARPTNQPVVQAAPRPNGAPIHASEVQPHPTLAPPNTGNPALDQRYKQQQEVLAAKQQQDHQKLQAQQEQEHQRLTQRQAPPETTQQIEQKHQQQTTQLEQKHTQQQQKLQNKQQASAGKPGNKQDENPPPKP